MILICLFMEADSAEERNESEGKVMDERQMMVCATALYFDGYSKRQIAEALGIDQDRAQELAELGGEAQGKGEMGRMEANKNYKPWGRDTEEGGQEGQ